MVRPREQDHQLVALWTRICTPITLLIVTDSLGKDQNSKERKIKGWSWTTKEREKKKKKKKERLNSKVMSICVDYSLHRDLNAKH